MGRDANVRRMAADARAVVTAYFDALARQDLEAAGACWSPDGIDELVGQATVQGPEGVRAFFGELFAAVPDFTFVVDGMVAEGNEVAVLWHAAGTFSGSAAYQGIEPTGGRVALRGLDYLTVADGRITGNVAFPDGMGFARQIGMLPAQGSGAEGAMLRAFNARTRVARKLAGTAAEPVADGVWRVRGGMPREMNVYLIEEDGGGVTVFDAGVRTMAPAIAAAASALGGIHRVVLGHGHVDHRGAAPALGAPVFCHADDREDAEGDAGRHYMDFGKLRPYARPIYPQLFKLWDGGPVKIEGTVAEDDDIAGFKVVAIPGHAPGQIALYRERDGLALTTDCFYTLDVQTGLHGPPRVALDAFNLDTEQARASIRKLAGIGPGVAWPGHAEPLTGYVPAQLERAAAET
jgi:glyoxylase-like metal-dependent hydrolase (beta-lactamase superfamily II)/predicted ester cyclase